MVCSNKAGWLLILFLYVEYAVIYINLREHTVDTKASVVQVLNNALYTRYEFIEDTFISAKKHYFEKLPFTTQDGVVEKWKKAIEHSWAYYQKQPNPKKLVICVDEVRGANTLVL